jgi:soluble lytic murein transglycosylase-like protein
MPWDVKPDLHLHPRQSSGRVPRLMGGASFLAVAVRSTAATLGVAAVGALLHQQHPKTVVEVPAPPATAPVVAAARVARPATWSLRAGGWYIRVDGAEVPVPSLMEQTASRPRASLGITISPFDRLIAYHAKAEGFDWRLIAALIFEESHFDPASRSDKGAVGLMQVRPIAAEAVGAREFETPAGNVQTGVQYLRQLDEMFHAAHGRERLAIILAAYNVGPGHVRDAQTLARAFGYDPNRWQDAMELMLPLLEHPSIYQQLPNGYAKGSETVAYVHRILERYEHYKRETLAASASE